MYEVPKNQDEYERIRAEIIKKSGCPFCNVKIQEVIKEYTHFFILANKFPYTENHILIVPKRHILSVDSMTKAERKEFLYLRDLFMGIFKSKLGSAVEMLKETKKPDKIEHLHLHIIEDGDWIVRKRIPFSMTDFLRSIKESKETSFLKVRDNIKKIKTELVESTFLRKKVVYELIEEGWEKRVQEMRKEGKFFYNGELLRFEGCKTRGDTLYLKVSKDLFYKDVVGLRYHSFDKYQNLEENLRPKALSVYNIIITSDSKLVARIRDKTGDWEESYEICGGFVRSSEWKDIFGSAKSRIQEDFGITIDKIKSIKFLSIYDYPRIAEIQMIFLVNLDLSVLKLQEFNPKIIYTENTKEGVEDFLGKSDLFHPPSIEALKVYRQIV